MCSTSCLENVVKKSCPAECSDILRIIRTSLVGLGVFLLTLAMSLDFIALHSYHLSLTRHCVFATAQG